MYFYMCVLYRALTDADMGSDNRTPRNVPGDTATPYVGSLGKTALGSGISQEPVNILFASRSSVEKRDVWQIDLIQILDILVGILEQSGKKDLRVAGMAALSSSLIYKMKVESISALRKSAMERKPMPVKRNYPDIELIGIPYRHESTYPVSLDDLLGLLQNLINTMANPVSKRRRREPLVIPEPPDIKDHLLSLETVIESYQEMILGKIAETGRGILQDITENLTLLDSIRCFFAALFLARDGRVGLKQVGDEVHIVAMPQVADGAYAEDMSGNTGADDDTTRTANGGDFASDAGSAVGDTGNDDGSLGHSDDDDDNNNVARGKKDYAAYDVGGVTGKDN